MLHSLFLRHFSFAILLLLSCTAALAGTGKHAAAKAQIQADKQQLAADKAAGAPRLVIEADKARLQADKAAARRARPVRTQP